MNENPTVKVRNRKILSFRFRHLLAINRTRQHLRLGPFRVNSLMQLTAFKAINYSNASSSHSALAYPPIRKHMHVARFCRHFAIPNLFLGFLSYLQDNSDQWKNFLCKTKLSILTFVFHLVFLSSVISDRNQQDEMN